MNLKITIDYIFSITSTFNTTRQVLDFPGLDDLYIYCKGSLEISPHRVIKPTNDPNDLNWQNTLLPALQNHHSFKNIELDILYKDNLIGGLSQWPPARVETAENLTKDSIARISNFSKRSERLFYFQMMMNNPGVYEIVMDSYFPGQPVSYISEPDYFLTQCYETLMKFGIEEFLTSITVQPYHSLPNFPMSDYMTISRKPPELLDRDNPIDLSRYQNPFRR